MDQVIEWDRELLLFLNGYHAAWLDPVMIQLTRTEVWLPLYLFFVFLIFHNHGKQGWLVMLGAALTILLADQITSSLMKPFFHRLRPSHDPSLEGLIHLVDGYRGGLYGFASSHAANTAGVAFFLFMVFKETYKWISLVFLWAILVTYTRIYLGVHYPGDVLVGALVGLGSGWAGYRFYLWVASKWPRKPVIE